MEILKIIDNIKQDVKMIENLLKSFDTGNSIDTDYFDSLISNIINNSHSLYIVSDCMWLF